MKRLSVGYVLLAGLPWLTSVGEDVPSPVDTIRARMEGYPRQGFTLSEEKERRKGERFRDRVTRSRGQ